MSWSASMRRWLLSRPCECTHTRAHTHTHTHTHHTHASTHDYKCRYCSISCGFILQPLNLIPTYAIDCTWFCFFTFVLHSELKGDDDAGPTSIFRFEVNIHASPSLSPSKEGFSPGSSKVTVGTITSHAFTFKFQYGNLVASTNAYLAYILEGVCVPALHTQRPVLTH